MNQSKKVNITLICHHCGHKWEYKGDKLEYAICPIRKCRYKVNINKNKII